MDRQIHVYCRNVVSNYYYCLDLNINVTKDTFKVDANRTSFVISNQITNLYKNVHKAQIPTQSVYYFPENDYSMCSTTCICMSHQDSEGKG